MASGSAVSCVERATSDLLIGPDWAINIELCDVLNSDPRQTKDVMKILKKRLGSKSPQIQLLALFVLETLSKNCGDYIYVQIVERDVLHEMTKIVKKKPDFLVKEKILSLVDAWQYAFSGSGNHPHYFAAYQELLNAGMKFPPREDNAVPLFTPPQTHPIVRPEMLPHEADVNHFIQASLQDVTPLSSSEIQNVHGTANVLMEMLSALHPHDRESAKQEFIIDLVEQCQSNQTRVMLLINNTVDEELLCQGLALNDDLQKVLQMHDSILKGKGNNTSTYVETTMVPTPPLVDVFHEDEESEDNFNQLTRRTTKESSGMGMGVLLPPPPPSTRPVNSNIDTTDYLSGDLYKATTSSDQSVSSSHGKSASPPIFTRQPEQPPFDEPTQDVKFTTEKVSAPAPVPVVLPKMSQSSSSSMSIPPPPTKHNQREKFFVRQQELENPWGQVSPNDSTSPPEPENPWGKNSYDDLTEKVQNLSVQKGNGSSSYQHASPPPARQGKPEDALFKDLVDFAKSKPGKSTR